jgi:hypothetical protein
MKKILYSALGVLAALALFALPTFDAHAAAPPALTVGGPTATGVVSTAAPVQTGGVDSTGKVRKVLTDASGRAIAGNVDRTSYTVATAEAIGATAKALGAIEADGTSVLRLRYIKICLDSTALQTAAGNRTLVLYPTTAASASGSTVTPVPLQSGDAAFAGVARTGALTTTTAIGSVTAANALWQTNIFMPAAATTATACVEKYFGTGDGVKPPTTSSAVTSGLALGDLTGGAGGTGNYLITMTFAVEPN